MDDQIDAPAMQAFRAYRRDGAGGEWQSVRAFEAGASAKSVDELLGAYQSHAQETSAHRVIRSLAAQELGRRKSAWDDPQVAARTREQVLQLLESERDFGLRGTLTIQLRALVSPDDDATAARLDGLAAREPNLYHVRPLLESVSYYIRNGCDDE